MNRSKSTGYRYNIITADHPDWQAAPSTIFIEAMMISMGEGVVVWVYKLIFWVASKKVPNR
jgi:hypothetical protein